MSSDKNDMKIDAARAKSLASAFQHISERVTKVSAGRNVRLVAVSKLKPASDVLALHKETGHVHFGENYAQELTEKAEKLPKEIQWHFIGGLQSNKCKPLASTIPNLYLVSSVDTSKKATQLSLGRSALDPPSQTPLHIHIQLNTSGEDSKSGCAPGTETTDLVTHVLDHCPNLKLAGFMTIGAIARSKATGEGKENEDFIALRAERDRVWSEFGDRLKQKGCEALELSMGMSSDFEGAIEAGSDEVRVGSEIFGARN